MEPRPLRRGFLLGVEMPRGNPEKLKPLNKRTKREQSEIAQKGGIASGKARAAAKTAAEILNALNSLPVLPNNLPTLDALGMPADMRTQKALRMVALHKKALSGDVNANRLLLEIEGEAPVPRVAVEMSDETKNAYEKAAEALKRKGG